MRQDVAAVERPVMRHGRVVAVVAGVVILVVVAAAIVLIRLA